MPCCEWWCDNVLVFRMSFHGSISSLHIVKVFVHCQTVSRRKRDCGIFLPIVWRVKKLPSICCLGEKVIAIISLLLPPSLSLIMAGEAKEAEAVLAPRLSLAPVTAAIAVTLTPPPLSLEHLWACHSPGKEGAKERGKEGQKRGSMLREICRREGRHRGRRRSSGCGGETEGKREKKER